MIVLACMALYKQLPSLGRSVTDHQHELLVNVTERLHKIYTKK